MTVFQTDILGVQVSAAWRSWTWDTGSLLCSSIRVIRPLIWWPDLWLLYHPLHTPSACWERPLPLCAVMNARGGAVEMDLCAFKQWSSISAGLGPEFDVKSRQSGCFSIKRINTHVTNAKLKSCGCLGGNSYDAAVIQRQEGFLFRRSFVKSFTHHETALKCHKRPKKTLKYNCTFYFNTMHMLSFASKLFCNHLKHLNSMATI